MEVGPKGDGVGRALDIFLVDTLQQRLDALSGTGALSREGAERALERWRLTSR